MRVIWFFLELAATAILLVAAVVFFLNLLVGSYFASRAGQGGEDFLFFYIYPLIISAVIGLWMLLQLPSRLLLCIGFYAAAERLYRKELAFLDRLPGPKWLWTMGTMGKLADVLAIEGKDREADEFYARVGLLSKEAGLFSSLVVGSSLENYAERLARADKLIDYAEWKGKFRGATIARRILTALWVALTVVAAQLSFKYMQYELPILASNLSYLGRYELADSLLSAQEELLVDNPQANAKELSALKVRMAENDIRWGRLAEAEDIYKKLLPLGEIESGKLDAFFQSQPVALQGLRDYAFLELRRGKLVEAERLYRKILALGDRITDRLALADCLFEAGKVDEARKEYQQAMDTCSKLNDREAAYPLMISAQTKLGRLALRTGDLAAAERHFADALTQAESNKKIAVDQLLTAVLDNMEVAFKKGDAVKGNEFKTRALELVGGTGPINSLATASRLHQVAVSLKNAGRTDGLDELLTRISDSVSRLTDSANPALTSYLLDRAEVAIAEKKFAEAENLATRAVAELVDRGLGSEYPSVLRGYVRLGESQFEQNKKDEANQNFQRALNIIQSRQNSRIPEEFEAALKRYNARLKANNAAAAY